MKCSPILFGCLLVLLLGCRTTPTENDQQAFESSLAEAQVLMTTLQTLDTGNIPRMRQDCFTSVCVSLSSMPYYESRGHPTAEQREHMVAVAKAALEYLLRHKEEFDPRLIYLSGGIAGLQKILRDSEDVRRLQELSNYFSTRVRQMSDERRP